MRNGYKVLDTDAHQMEPPSMWAEYIDPAFADRAPGMDDMGGGRKGMMCEGEPLAKQDGSYPMHSKEFLEAAHKAMQRFERARSQSAARRSQRRPCCRPLPIGHALPRRPRGSPRYPACTQPLRNRRQSRQPQFDA